MYVLCLVTHTVPCQSFSKVLQYDEEKYIVGVLTSCSHHRCAFQFVSASDVDKRKS